MSEEQTTINYGEELTKLEEKTKMNVWKPGEGSHIVTFLSEPEDCAWTKDTGEKVEQWKFLIEVKGEQCVWFIPKSSQRTSIRGQLVKLGSLKGKLMGVQTTVIVVGKGKERRYTVPEAHANV